jgi:hypothetical protein
LVGEGRYRLPDGTSAAEINAVILRDTLTVERGKAVLGKSVRGRERLLAPLRAAPAPGWPAGQPAARR